MVDAKEYEKNLDKDSNMILDGHKLIYHLDRVKALLRGERIAPITIDFSLTRSCNYRCTYCYAPLQENVREVLTKEVLFRFLDDCAEIGVKAISLVSDGESICSPHVYDFISYGKKKGLDMAIGTNGSILKEERLKEMLSALTYLRFNISAGEPKRYAEIHGVDESFFHKVCEIIRKCVQIKKENNFDVTIGLQMVLMPEFKDQVIPLAKLGKELGVDYAVIKHCSDDETGSLGVNYSGYKELTNLLKKAESYSTKDYLVKAKWSKIMSEGKRRYAQCYGPPLI
ncbi:radical SAM protein, partial [Thermoproteota archaeon]